MIKKHPLSIAICSLCLTWGNTSSPADDQSHSPGQGGEPLSAELNLRSVPDQDKFSGKTVTTADMAYAMIGSRKDNPPRVGEPAPYFTVKSLDGGKEVRLQDLHLEKPVVLILSSWSCDIFRESLGGLTALHHNYGPKAQFVMVYIREAHPFGCFAGHLGRVEDPKTIKERAAVAKRCKDQLRIPFPILIDGMDDKVATRWGSWPVRAFVIETNGTVAYAGMQGPWGYLPYHGFQHGNGIREREDLQYSQETLERFLQKRFPDASENAVPIPQRTLFRSGPAWQIDSERLSMIPIQQGLIAQRTLLPDPSFFSENPGLRRR